MTRSWARRAGSRGGAGGGGSSTRWVGPSTTCTGWRAGGVASPPGGRARWGRGGGGGRAGGGGRGGGRAGREMAIGAEPVLFGELHGLLASLHPDRDDPGPVQAGPA